MRQEELNELARRCQQQNDVFRRTGRSDPSYCLQLFRLALAEKREEAWEKILECYTPDLRNWFFAHPSAPLLRNYEDDICMMTFELLLKRNEKEPLNITSLGAILNYLRRCFYTAVLLCKRDRDSQRLIDGAPDDEIPGPDPIGDLLDSLAAQEIWKRVASCTDNALEERVMYLRLILNYTASEIVRHFPGDHLTQQKVFQIVEKVIRRYGKLYPRATET